MRIGLQLEIQREMNRLRDELVKTKRSESQREREMAFLQTQLVDAVERISSLEARIRDLEESKRQLVELKASIDSAAFVNKKPEVASFFQIPTLPVTPKNKR